jgi:hypothetical protein
MTFRVTRISDAHLSREKPFFVENFTGFIVPDSQQSRYGEKEVGHVEHRFEHDGCHSSIFVRVPGSKRLDIADFAEAAYGGSL